MFRIVCLIPLEQSVQPCGGAGLAPGPLVMLNGPRDEGEVEVLFRLILAAVHRAGDVTPTTHEGADKDA
jgi:hypothetical protein